MAGLDMLRKLVEDIDPDADPILYDILEEGTDPRHGVDARSRKTLSKELGAVVTMLESETREVARLASEIMLSSHMRYGGDQQVRRWAERLEGAFDLRPSDEADADKLADSSAYADLQGEIFSVCQALGLELEKGDTGSDALTKLYEAIEHRLMPEGMEWPRYEDGEPVRFEDELPDFAGTIYKTVKSIRFNNYGYVVIDNAGGSANVSVILKSGQRIKRPAVPAADGGALEAGQTVWHVDTGAEYWVKSGQTITSDAVVIIRKTDCDCESEIVKASQLTHTKPEPPKRCRDCRHWQGDPSASHMGVCFNSYMERCCEDSYAAQLDYAEACDDFEERGE